VGVHGWGEAGLVWARGCRSEKLRGGS
jgi:hypothetical protein